MKNLKKIVVISIALGLLLSFGLTLAEVQGQNFVFDGFNTGEIQPPNTALPWDYWYKTVISADQDGLLKEENLVHDVSINNAVALSVQHEGLKTFARFALNPQSYPGFPNIAALGECRDAFCYQQPHRWLPTVDHPVVWVETLRASSNYQADGSGGAGGTFVTQLWNAPDAYSDPQNHQTDTTRDDSGFFTHVEDLYSISYTWTDAATFGGSFRGFKVLVSDHAFGAPTYIVDLSSMNINTWFEVKTVWSVDASGVQSLVFYVNDQQVGSTTLAVPMPTLESYTIIDNEEAQFNQNGLFFVDTNPSSLQYWDINRVRISQF